MSKYNIQGQPQENAIWKKIVWKGQELNYEASTCGHIRNYTTKKIMSQTVKWKTHQNKALQYLQVTLRINNQTKYVEVHRLLASTFLPAPKIQDPVVDHIDDDPFNNHITNLQYLSRGQNWGKKWAKRVEVTNEETKETKLYFSIAETARQLKISEQTIIKKAETQEVYKNLRFKILT